MKKPRLIKARNTKSELTSHGIFFKQKEFQSKIHYQSVYEALNELTEKGYNCFQIEQIIKLGEIEFNKKK